MYGNTNTRAKQHRICKDNCIVRPNYFLTVPNTPIVSAIPGNQSIAISWVVVPNDGYPVSGYILNFNGTIININNPAITTYDASGLENGVAYSISVTALNQDGASPPSTPIYVTPITVPDPPIIDLVTPGNTQISVNWHPAIETGGSPLTGFFVIVTLNGDNIQTIGPIDPLVQTATIYDLSNDTPYTISVVSTNAAGNSLPATVGPYIPGGVPNPPVITSVNAGNTTIFVQWRNASQSVHYPVLNYTLHISSEQDIRDITNITDISYTIHDLSNGILYTLSVFAFNEIGSSLSSDISSATPYTVPDPPTQVSAANGKQSIEVFWEAPVKNGGSPILGYKLYVSSAGGHYTPYPILIANPTANSYVVTGLTDPTIIYSVFLVSYNAAGDSQPSSVVTAQPYTVPGAPTGLSGIPGNKVAILSWTPPVNNGGTPITGYIINVYENGIPVYIIHITVPTLQSYIVDGLINGVHYTIYVNAVNIAGISANSNTVVVIPNVVPNPPRNVIATAGKRQIYVSWTIPVDNDAYIDYYIVYANAFPYIGTTATNYTITGLTANTLYGIQVQSHNTSGNSALTDYIYVTVYDIPNSPILTLLNYGNKYINVSWTEPFNNSSPIQSYTLDVSSATDISYITIPYHSGTNTYNISNLKNAVKYDIYVYATNAAGNSLPSNDVSAMPFTVPDTTVLTYVNFGSRFITVSWPEPFNNGYTIQYYLLTVSGSTDISFIRIPYIGGPTTYTAGGLTNGVQYYLNVLSHNLAGDSSASNIITAMPNAVPDQPIMSILGHGNGFVDVSWNTPYNGGTYPILTYTVNVSGGTTPISPIVLLVGTNTYHISGLSNGITYSFQVYATNFIGNSTPSVPVYAMPNVVTGAPTIGIVGHGNGFVDVSWSTPVNIGTPIDYYLLNISGPTSISSVNVSYGTNTYDISGLSNGTTYYFYIYAHNAEGFSSQSNKVSAMPNVVPGAPTIGITNIGDQRVVVNWSTPINGGTTITKYVLDVSGPTTITPIDVPYGTNTYDISGLSNGTNYTFYVYAVNVEGSSLSSNKVSAIPYGVPFAPITTLTGFGDRFVDISWSVPYNNGSSIQQYIVDVSSSTTKYDVSYSSTTTSAHFVGLTNGLTYTFYVYATNAAGKSLNSNNIQAIPNVIPAAPSSISGTPGDRAVTLSWSQTSAFAAGIIYTVTSNPGGFTSTSTTTTATVNGLTNNIFYTFTIDASNSAGHNSAVSGSYKPNLKPPAPTIQSVGTFDQSITVSWTQPVSTASGIIYIASAADGINPPISAPSTTDLTSTIYGLINANSYNVYVDASNSAGDSISVSGPFIPNRVPLAPTTIIGTPGNHYVNLSWIQPASTASGIIYIVTSTPGGLKATSTTTIATVSGLTNNIPYTFIVDASNSAGHTPSTASASYIPNSVPLAPNITSVLTYDQSAVVTWTQPASDASGITYIVTASGGGTTISTPVTSNLITTVYGLTNAVPYTFYVDASNSSGHSISVSGPFIPNVVPPVPSITSVTPYSKSALVTWTQPASDASGITYIVTASGGGSQILSSPTIGLITTVAGLTNAIPYTFYVDASNSKGHNTSTVSGPFIPNMAPLAPTITSVLTYDQSASITWSPPSNDASGIVYTITSTPSSSTFTSTTTNVTVTGLTNNIPYTFYVDASNSMGHINSASGPFIPNIIPAAPSSIIGTPGNHLVDLSWSQTQLNASGILYTITSNPPSSTFTSTTTHITFTGLTNNTPYLFVIDASNSKGHVSSNSASYIPNIIPNAPNITSVFTYDQSASVTWTQSQPDASGIVYIVTASGSGIQKTSLPTSGFIATVSGLTNNVPYTFYVDASNSAGHINSLSGSFITNAVPLAPNIASVLTYDQSAAVTWTQPVNTASGIVYIVTASGGGTQKTSLPTSGFVATVSGLTNNVPYTFYVDASNMKGHNTSGVSGPYIPNIIPLAPNISSVLTYDQSAAVIWTQPVNTASGIVYIVTASGGGTTISAPSTTGFSSTVTGLTNNVPYTFYVDASNSKGDIISGVSGPYITNAVPLAPNIASVLTYDQSAAVTWTQPINTASGIVYIVTASGGGIKKTSLPTSGLVATVSGLTNNVPYTFYVDASNTKGHNTSGVSGPYIPNIIPLAPNIASVVTYDQSASVTWTQPVNTASGIVYIVTASGGGIKKTSLPTSGFISTVSGLTNNVPYYIYVDASNSKGNVTSGVSGPYIPNVVPIAPIITNITNGFKQATVTWTQPVNTASGITYILTASGGGTKIPAPSTSALSATVTGLTNGTSYYFYVDASNSATTVRSTVSGPTVIGPTATGGNSIYTITGYKVHTFTTVGTSTFTIINNISSIDFLIVGAGGSGYPSIAGGTGGGGGGNVIYNKGVSISNASYPIIVGNGVGNGNGGNSSFNGITASGGYIGTVTTGGKSGSGLFVGGIGNIQSTLTFGGGGAGDVSNGNAPTTGKGGNGGNGIAIDISGSIVYYGGGGGGGAAGVSGGTYYGGSGGLGGGGDGGNLINNSYTPGSSGTANTGGGGGGNNQQGAPLSNAGSGGSGIVIIRYPY